MESNQSYASLLTHYSTEPLTTGPAYDPLLLLLALAGKGTSNLCTRCSHWVHSRSSGLPNVADYRRANGWTCTACRAPPQPRTPSPPPSPAYTPTMSDKTFNILQWNANVIGNKQTELSPNIQKYTIVRQDRCLVPGGGLLFSSITQSTSLASHCQQHRRMTPT